MSKSRLVRVTLGRVLVLLWCLGLVTTTVVAAEALHAVKPEGSTELIFKASSGNIIRVVVSQTQLGVSYLYKDALLWGGDVGEPPPLVLSSIRIRVNNEKVFVPLSAYSDLGDVKSASLDSTEAGVTLNLHGGETATSYDATFNFSGGYLVSRTVRLREFPDERWEKTHYSFPKRAHE